MLRRLGSRGLGDGSYEAVEVMCLGLRGDREPVIPSLTGRLGADRDNGRAQAESRESAGGRCGREHGEIAFGRLGGAKLACSVEDDRVGAEHLGQVGTSVLRAYEENTARFRRQLGDEALLRGNARDQSGLDAMLAKRRSGPRA